MHNLVITPGQVQFWHSLGSVPGSRQAISRAGYLWLRSAGVIPWRLLTQQANQWNMLAMEAREQRPLADRPRQTALSRSLFPPFSSRGVSRHLLAAHRTDCVHQPPTVTSRAGMRLAFGRGAAAPYFLLNSLNPNIFSQISQYSIQKV